MADIDLRRVQWGKNPSLYRVIVKKAREEAKKRKCKLITKDGVEDYTQHGP